MAQSEEQIAEGVAKALIVAQEAVENDIEKEYVLAVQCYTDAVHQIAEIAGQLPSHLYKALYEKATLYSARATQLREALTSLSDGPKAKRNNIVSPLPIAFEDNSSNIATQFMYSQPLPQHPRYYCFFLTNIVAGTLRRGGFMTESVYVPRVIWRQTGAEIPAQLLKVALCKFLTQDCLNKIDRLSFGELELAQKELELIVTDLGIAQNFLAESLESVPKIKRDLPSGSREKKLYAQRKNRVLEKIRHYRKTAGDMECVDTLEYADALQEYFDKTSPYERWLQKSEQLNLVKMIEILSKVAAFFDMMIAWIIDDLNLLILQYHAAVKRSFLETTPLPGVSDISTL